MTNSKLTCTADIADILPAATSIERTNTTVMEVTSISNLPLSPIEELLPESNKAVSCYVIHDSELDVGHKCLVCQGGVMTGIAPLTTHNSGKKHAKKVFNLMHADVATAGGLTFAEAEERLKKLRETRSPAIVNSLGGSGIPNLRASIGTGEWIYAVLYLDREMRHALIDYVFQEALSHFPTGDRGSWSDLKSWSKDESRLFVIPFGFSGLVNLSMPQRRFYAVSEIGAQLALTSTKTGALLRRKALYPTADN